MEESGIAKSRLEVMGMDVVVMFVPGHNPGCLAYRMGNYLFSGDAYIPNVKIVTNVPKADKPLALKNYAMLEELSKGMTVCAGHGEIVINSN